MLGVSGPETHTGRTLEINGGVKDAERWTPR